MVLVFLVKLPADPKSKGKGSFEEFLDKFDLIGTLVLIPWVICLLFALQWGGSKYPWSNWRIILLLVLFSVLFIVWIYLQILKGDKGTVPPRIIKQRSMASGVWFFFCIFSTFFIIIYYIPIWFQTVRRQSAYQSGISFLTTSAGQSVTIIATGLLVSLMNNSKQQSY